MACACRGNKPPSPKNQVAKPAPRTSGNRPIVRGGSTPTRRTGVVRSRIR